MRCDAMRCDVVSSTSALGAGVRLWPRTLEQCERHRVLATAEEALRAVDRIERPPATAGVRQPLVVAALDQRHELGVRLLARQRLQARQERQRVAMHAAE